MQNEKQRKTKTKQPKNPTTNRKHVWLLHTFLETICATCEWYYDANPGSCHPKQCACGDISSILNKPLQEGCLDWTSPCRCTETGQKTHGLESIEFRSTSIASATNHCFKQTQQEQNHPLKKKEKKKKKKRDTEIRGKWFKNLKKSVPTL